MASTANRSSAPTPSTLSRPKRPATPPPPPPNTPTGWTGPSSAIMELVPKRPESTPSPAPPPPPPNTPTGRMGPPNSIVELVPKRPESTPSPAPPPPPPNTPTGRACSKTAIVELVPRHPESTPSPAPPPPPPNTPTGRVHSTLSPLAPVFTPFTRLPLEVRQHVWSHSIEPRTLGFNLLSEMHVWPYTPAVLHACRDSREWAKRWDGITVGQLDSSGATTTKTKKTKSAGRGGYQAVRRSIFDDKHLIYFHPGIDTLLCFTHGTRQVDFDDENYHIQPCGCGMYMSEMLVEYYTQTKPNIVDGKCTHLVIPRPTEHGAPLSLDFLPPVVFQLRRIAVDVGFLDAFVSSWDRRSWWAAFCANPFLEEVILIWDHEDLGYPLSEHDQLRAAGEKRRLKLTVGEMATDDGIDEAWRIENKMKIEHNNKNGGDVAMATRGKPKVVKFDLTGFDWAAEEVARLRHIWDLPPPWWFGEMPNDPHILHGMVEWEVDMGPESAPGLTDIWAIEKVV